MKVRVYYMAHLKQAAGRAIEEVEFGVPCTAGELVRRLAERHGDPLRRLLLDARGDLQPTILLFVNDTQVTGGGAVALRDGDEVSLLAPIAGGSVC
jgi:molybdopterin converting factor small subunit